LESSSPASITFLVTSVSAATMPVAPIAPPMAKALADSDCSEPSSARTRPIAATAPEASPVISTLVSLGAAICGLSG